MDGPSGKRAGQRQTCGLGQRRHQQARGVLVQAVHDAGPEALLTRQFGKMSQKPVNQGAFRATGTGVDRQPGGLVHHRHAFVPIQDGEFTVLGRQCPLRDGQTQFHNAAFLQAGIGIRANAAVYPAQTALHRLLDPRPGQPGGPACKNVKTRAAFARADDIAAAGRSRLPRAREIRAVQVAVHADLRPPGERPSRSP